MTTKSKMRLEIKELSAEGSFEGLLSPYNVVDGGKDVIEPGAYTKTLKEGGPTRPMLWQHKADQPIGLLTLEDRPEGLWCKGQILMEIPNGKTSFALIKAGIVKGLSIGFESIKDSIESGIRHLKEIKLYEGSVVTFPMASSALIASVKALTEMKDGFSDELASIQIIDTDYQIMQALSIARRSVIWSEMTRDEKIAARAAINQEYAEADATFFPEYLDALDERYGGMEMYAANQRENKAGATISAANKEKIKAALAQVLSAHESLSALISEEAGTTTSDEKAAAVEEKPEPVPDHSAEAEILSGMRLLIPA